MDPLRKAVGIDSVNPGECASITDWKIQGHSLCFFGNSSSGPDIRPHDLIVAVRAAGVNRADLSHRKGAYQLDSAQNFSRKAESSDSRCCEDRDSIQDDRSRSAGVSARRSDTTRAGKIRHIRRAMVVLQTIGEVLARHVVCRHRRIPRLEWITGVLGKVGRARRLRLLR